MVLTVTLTAVCELIDSLRNTFLEWLDKSMKCIERAVLVGGSDER